MELLEREPLLRELDEALEKATAGEGRIALVSGEAGIGKTSLVEQFVRERKGSVRVLWGTCDSFFTPRPLGPLHDIALQSKGELLEVLNSESNREAIFSSCFIELNNRQTIIVFEDIHWADEATLDLIKYLGRRIQRTPSMMILTYRDDELSSNHPLWAVLGDLPRTATYRLQLLPLSKSSVFALASAAGQAERSKELYVKTGGNPFFLTEVIASESESIPATVRDAVLVRAARLSLSARAVLEVAAMIGFRVEPWLISDLVGGESALVEECIKGGMLGYQGDYYVFRHELARQAVLETVSPQEKLTLHRQILNALKKSPETQNDLIRLASHAEGANDRNAVLDYAPAAAQEASTASSHREAIALFELALRFADSLPPIEHAHMLDAYVVELRFASRLADSATALKKAIELWHSIGDRLREGDDLESLAIASYLIGRNDEADQAIHSAVAILETLPPSAELAKAYRGQCFIRMENRDCAEAVTWGEKAIALAERFHDTETLARVCNYAGCAMMFLDYERGCALMERSLAIGRESNHPFAIAGTLANMGQMLVEHYQFDEAERYLTEGLVYTFEQDDEYHYLEILTWQAMARLYQGYWVELDETLSNVLKTHKLDLTAYTYALLTLGRLRVRKGDSNAVEAIDEGLTLSRQANAIVRLGYAHSTRAEMFWLTGDNPRAIEVARQIYDYAVSKLHPWVVGELAFWRWRAGDTLTHPEWIARPYALQISGDWRGAAEEWERRGCPYEHALALMDGDEVAQLAALDIFMKLGADPAAEKLRQKLRSQGIRGIKRGPRPTTSENPFGLTARELEVLACLIDGSSNSAIADKLSLSTRTVEHHIASILQKFQVQSRTEVVTMMLKENLFPLD